MSEGILKFAELARTDEEFQGKLKAAMENYTGEQTEEAIFINVLTPLENEYGISATYEDFRKYVEELSDQELNSDEISQVSGGGKGFGANACYAIGIGAGGTVNCTEYGEGNICVGVGFGKAKASACAGKGTN